MCESISRRTLLQGAATSALAVTLGEETRAADLAPRAGEPGQLPMRELGKTGVRVPILGYGTAPLGLRRSLSEGIAILNEAIDRGVTYMDTAPRFMNYGQAQVMLGEVLNARRKKVFLVTKCFRSTYDETLQLLEQNLKELKTDHADLVYVHSLGDLDYETVIGPKGAFAALEKAREMGLTRFIGVSGHNRPRRFLEVLERFDIDVMMNVVNFVDQFTYNFENRVWPVAARKKVGLVGMKVFGGIKGTGAWLPAEHMPLAYRYAQSLPHITTAVIGMGTRDELLQNIAWAQALKPLTDAERAQMADLGRRLAAEWRDHLGPA
ncbi:MAG: aldo/keto reductase [Armatimonadetes bacterium]|nr:aldo/keto reductase [Armatimonadota bacterium]